MMVINTVTDTHSGEASSTKAVPAFRCSCEASVPYRYFSTTARATTREGICGFWVCMMLLGSYYDLHKQEHVLIVEAAMRNQNQIGKDSTFDLPNTQQLPSSTASICSFERPGSTAKNDNANAKTSAPPFSAVTFHGTAPPSRNPEIRRSPGIRCPCPGPMPF